MIGDHTVNIMDILGQHFGNFYEDCKLYNILFGHGTTSSYSLGRSPITALLNPCYDDNYIYPFYFLALHKTNGEYDGAFSLSYIIVQRPSDITIDENTEFIATVKNNGFNIGYIKNGSTIKPLAANNAEVFNSYYWQGSIYVPVGETVADFLNDSRNDNPGNVIKNNAQITSAVDLERGYYQSFSFCVPNKANVDATNYDIFSSVDVYVSDGYKSITSTKFMTKNLVCNFDNYIGNINTIIRPQPLVNNYEYADIMEYFFNTCADDSRKYNFIANTYCTATVSKGGSVSESLPVGWIPFIRKNGEWKNYVIINYVESYTIPKNRGLSVYYLNNYYAQNQITQTGIALESVERNKTTYPTADYTSRVYGDKNDTKIVYDYSHELNLVSYDGSLSIKIPDDQALYVHNNASGSYSYSYFTKSAINMTPSASRVNVAYNRSNIVNGEVIYSSHPLYTKFEAFNNEVGPIYNLPLGFEKTPNFRIGHDKTLIFPDLLSFIKTKCPTTESYESKLAFNGGYDTNLCINDFLEGNIDHSLGEIMGVIYHKNQNGEMDGFSITMATPYINSSVTSAAKIYPTVEMTYSDRGSLKHALVSENGTISGTQSYNITVVYMRIGSNVIETLATTNCGLSDSTYALNLSDTNANHKIFTFNPPDLVNRDDYEFYTSVDLGISMGSRSINERPLMTLASSSTNSNNQEEIPSDIAEFVYNTVAPFRANIKFEEDLKPIKGINVDEIEFGEYRECLIPCKHRYDVGNFIKTIDFNMTKADFITEHNGTFTNVEATADGVIIPAECTASEGYVNAILHSAVASNIRKVKFFVKDWPKTLLDSTATADSTNYRTLHNVRTERHIEFLFSINDTSKNSVLKLINFDPLDTELEVCTTQYPSVVYAVKPTSFGTYVIPNDVLGYKGTFYGLLKYNKSEDFNTTITELKWNYIV